MVGVRKWGVFGIALAGIFSGILAGAFFSLNHDLPQINELKQFRPSEAGFIYSADGQVITRLYLEKRFPVTIDQIPEVLIDAFITTEDRRFFSHRGLDLKSLLRALISDIKAGHFKQGGSTLTQQLAKTLFLTSEKSLIRKIKEALLTVQIERRYTKKEILELYLNLIYLGSGSYGVQAASRTYFGKDVQQITLPEAAMLAGLPKAPSRYSPLNHPKESLSRRNVILAAMLSTGTISPDRYESALRVPYAEPARDQARNSAPYFTEYIKNELKQHIRLDTLYTSGLKIHTTLDANLQEKGQQAISRHLGALEKRMALAGKNAPFPQAALVAIDTNTGEIISLIGGRDYTVSQFNRATHAVRQPGSAFKPFVYAAAVENGFDQNTLITDAPLRLTLPGTRKEWRVENFSRTFDGEMTLRRALALSKNTPAVRLIHQVGIEKVIDLARRFGITSDLYPSLSLALGTSELSLMELSAAYIPFANAGIRVDPYGIRKILDADGRIIFEAAPDRRAVFSARHAAVMTDMLKAVILEGTGKKAAVIHKETAGKTGTTDQCRDALFIGFSRDIVTGVWVGNDDSTPLGPGETGARAALPIWLDYMTAFLADKPYQFFDIPEGTRVIFMDPRTGKQVDQHTPQAVRAVIMHKSS